jgi:hypothetical protein
MTTPTPIITRTETKRTLRTIAKILAILLLVPLLLLLLWGIHSLIWDAPVTSYTLVERAPNGEIIPGQNISSNNSNVATAIRNAFNQGAAIVGGRECLNTPMINYPPLETFVYNFYIWGILVESVRGPVSVCNEAKVDSALSPPIWVGYDPNSIPYTPPPPYLVN